MKVSLLVGAFLAASLPFAMTLVADEGKSSGDVVSVAIYRGPGVAGPGPDDLKLALEAEPERFSARFVGPDEVRDGILGEFDVVVFPGGSGSKQAEGLGEEGREIVRAFVAAGGGYVGICAGCYLACENYSWSLKILDARTKSSKWRRGRKDLELGVPDGAGERLGISGASFVVKYANGPIMEPANSPDLPDYTVLAVFNEEVAENETPEGIQVGSPAILAAPFGKGRVVGVSPHPEQSEDYRGVVPRLLVWAAGREADKGEAKGSEAR
jgi:putative intracellular protease/amidase